jgi:hypothetical protein
MCPSFLRFFAHEPTEVAPTCFRVYRSQTRTGATERLLNVPIRHDTGVKPLLVAVLLAALLPSAAAALVDVRPGLLEAGEDVDLLVELPELRPGDPPTALDVRGAAVRQISSRAAGRVGVETQWRVRVAVVAEPGPSELRLRASFADGRVVEVRRAVTVVPAEADGGVPVAAAAAAAAGLLALLGAAVVLRRRSAP